MKKTELKLLADSWSHVKELPDAERTTAVKALIGQWCAKVTFSLVTLGPVSNMEHSTCGWQWWQLGL